MNDEGQDLLLPLLHETKLNYSPPFSFPWSLKWGPKDPLSGVDFVLGVSIMEVIALLGGHFNLSSLKRPHPTSP